MTREEAAEMIRNDIKLHHDDLSGQYRKALRMAIEALQTDIVRCKDCKWQVITPVSDRVGVRECDLYGHATIGDFFCASGEKGKLRGGDSK